MMEYLQCKNGFSPREAPDHHGFCGYGHYEEEYGRSDDGWKISFLRPTRLRIDPLPLDTPLKQLDLVKASPTWLPTNDRTR